jgi:enamine deaminase RidA (YjgF/YER057c/UK114 family)
LLGNPTSYVQYEAVSGVSVRRIEIDGRVIGGVYEDDGVVYCVLGDIRPRDRSASRCEQALSVLDQLRKALEAAGMGIENIVRTWFFVDRILDWYGEFNAARSSVFDKWGLFDRILPASTGIGAANSHGAALVADAIAMRCDTRTLEMRNVVSPLQCPAMTYKSSFSRAVEMKVPGGRQLYISGTASIAPDGKSAHRGDLDRQIALSMSVVREILLSRGMEWSDVSRGVAYFKGAPNVAALERYCRVSGIPDLPLAIASADICRDDLLFEIEIDATVTEEAR